MKPFDAIVLAGGEGKRLGGVDKALLTIGSSTMLERVLGALTDAERIVCVGPRRPTSMEVTWTRESPAGGGPTPAVGAGLEYVEAPTVVVLAVDVPLVSSSVVRSLVEECSDAALVTDGDGIPQPLIAAYDAAVLRKQLSGYELLHGVPFKRVIREMNLFLLDEPEVAVDCDTWAELESVRKGVAGG